MLLNKIYDLYMGYFLKNTICISTIYDIYYLTCLHQFVSNIIHQ